MNRLVLQLDVNTRRFIRALGILSFLYVIKLLWDFESISPTWNSEQVITVTNGVATVGNASYLVLSQAQWNQITQMFFFGLSGFILLILSAIPIIVAPKEKTEEEIQEKKEEEN